MATTRQPSFFKFLIGDHFCDKLKIPKAFLRHFNGEVPEQCRLKTRTQTWVVDSEKVGHKFYFQNGWKEFVHDNGLKDCEFLVFFYEGNSEFYVHIYGKSCCRREFVEAAREEGESLKSNNVGISREKEKAADSDDTSVEILDEFPPFSKRRGEKSSLPSHQPQKNDSSSWSGKAVNETMSKQKMRHEEIHCPKPAGIKRKSDFPEDQYVGGTSTSKIFVRPKLEVLDDDGNDDIEEEDSEEEDNDDEDEDEDEESDEDEGESDDYIEILDEFPQYSNAKTIRKSPVGLHKQKKNSVKARAQSSIRRASGSSSNQRITDWKLEVPKTAAGYKKMGELIACQRASDFMSESGRPSCSITMRPSYLYGTCVPFPRQFYTRHLKGHRGYINFRVNKRSWRLGLHTIRETIRVQTGWTKFVRENELKEGDVCVFVLIDSFRYVCDVTIFRAAEAANSTLAGGKQPTGIQFKSKKGKEKAE